MSLKHTILVLLETEPSSGYDLVRSFKQRLGYFWNAKHQQVYQQLKQLTEEKCIEYSVETQTDKPDKKVYSITPTGIAELQRWVAESVAPNKVNDPLLVKIYGGHLTSRENLLEELDRHIDTHQKTLGELEALEQAYQALGKAGKDQMMFPYVTLRRGILGERAWLAWADEAREMIAG